LMTQGAYGLLWAQMAWTHSVTRAQHIAPVLSCCRCTPSMFITLWFGFDYWTNPPLGTLII
jgi:hypothetical protein